MTVKEIYNLIRIELLNKKVFTAKWQARCDICGNVISQGDDFFFLGDKKKLCDSCFGDLLEYFESDEN